MPVLTEDRVAGGIGLRRGMTPPSGGGGRGGTGFLVPSFVEADRNVAPDDRSSQCCLPGSPAPILFFAAFRPGRTSSSAAAGVGEYPDPDGKQPHAGTGRRAVESRPGCRAAPVAGRNGDSRNRVRFRPDRALAADDRLRSSSDIDVAQFVLLRTHWPSRCSYPWRSHCTCLGFRQGVECRLSSMSFEPLRLCATYWHFMGGVWLYLILLLVFA